MKPSRISIITWINLLKPSLTVNVKALREGFLMTFMGFDQKVVNQALNQVKVLVNVIKSLKISSRTVNHGGKLITLTDLTSLRR